jgi:integrase/recombinase XerD
MDNLVADFKDWLKINQKLSSTTIDVYLASIRDFLQYYQQMYDDKFTHLEEGIVTMYRVYLDLKEFPASTIKARISGLKKFNQFLVDKEFQIDYVVKLDYPNIEKTNEKNNLTSLDIKNFLSSIKAEGNKRDLAIVMLKLKTDITISEIMNLKIEDYIDGEKLIIQKNKNFICIDEDTKEKLDEYLQERKSFSYSTSNYLFVSNKSEQLQRRQIFNLFKKYSEIAGLSTPVTPKKLENFKDINWKDELTVLSDFSFCTENEEGTVSINFELITNDFNKDSFVKAVVKVKCKDTIKKFFLIFGKPGIMEKFINEEEIFLTKGWLLTHSLNQLKITKFIKNLIENENTVASINIKLENISMEEATFKSVK